MEKIMTAEEYVHTQYLKRREEVGPGQFYPEPPSTEQIKDMIEFAKLHVEAALKAASINAETEQEAGNLYDPEDRYYVVNKDSILNAYPLENVK